MLLSFQLVTHNSQLVTRNSCFIVSRKNKEQFSSSRLYFVRIVFWLCNFLWRWNNLFVVSAFLELIYLFWAHASTPHMYSLDKNFWIFERYNVFCYLSVFFFFFNVRKKLLTYLLTYLLAHSLFPYCCSCSLISCWLCKFCSLIFQIWFWTMVLWDSSSTIPLLSFLGVFLNCNLICFSNLWKKFPHICLNYFPWLQILDITFELIHFLIHVSRVPRFHKDASYTDKTKSVLRNSFINLWF